MYHEISPRRHPGFEKYVVSPRRFAIHMRWLKMTGYRAITLRNLVASRFSRSPLPSRPVLITFDDGFRDCVQYASEILNEHGFTATFFLVAGLMGQTSGWLRGERGIELPLADWGSARALTAAGFECGAHSLTHPRLTTLSTQECRRELQTSRDLLEERLGHEIVHLAYPFGAYDARVREVAEECGYRSACTVEIGLAAAEDDPLALRRVPISGADTLADFVWRLRGGWSVGEAYGRWRAGARTHDLVR